MDRVKEGEFFICLCENRTMNLAEIILSRGSEG
jgi:hypothetical protein